MWKHLSSDGYNPLYVYPCNISSFIHTGIFHEILLGIEVGNWWYRFPWVWIPAPIHTTPYRIYSCESYSLSPVTIFLLETVQTVHCVCIIQALFLPRLCPENKLMQVVPDCCVYVCTLFAPVNGRWELNANPVFSPKGITSLHTLNALLLDIHHILSMVPALWTSNVMGQH